MFLLSVHCGVPLSPHSPSELGFVWPFFLCPFVCRLPLCADPLPVWVIRRARHDHLAGRVTKLESGTYKVDVCRATDSLQGDAWAGAIVLLTQTRQGLRLRPLRRRGGVLLACVR